jgi:phosphate:Na+ symporter
MRYKSILTPVCILFTCGLAIILAGCTQGAAPIPDRLIADKHASGDNQAEFHGETLPQPFQVVLEGPVEPGLLGGKGERRAVHDAKIRFEVENPLTGARFVENDGIFIEKITDAGGAAVARMKLGNWCGDVWVVASTPDYPSLKPVRMRAISGVRRIGKDLEAATGTEVGEIGLEMQNPDGTPAAGIEVFFRVQGGSSSDSSVEKTRVISDAQGRAVTTWKMGEEVKRYFCSVQINDNRHGIEPKERFDVALIEYEAMAMNKAQLFIVLLGGLAVFIFGMTIMSKGLQRMADKRLRAALQFMTRNRFMGVLTGTVITAIIQSSSATTVMLIGFVNAGMLTLAQAIGVVFGANIGTTMTAQLIAFNVEEMAYPAIAVGLLMSMIFKRPQMKAAWESLLGFGLLFLGMMTMSDILKPLRYSPEFIAWFSWFDCAPESGSGLMPLIPVIMCVFIGTATTCVVQSSSATIGIVLALCSQGIINFHTAVPLILGDNIGTTITANMAALNANRDAKRVALAHTFFNLFGSAYMILLFYVPVWNGQPFFLGFVDWITPGEVFSSHPENLLRHAANSHTFFNIFNVALFLPFTVILARICHWIIPVREAEQETVLQYLEPNLLQSPAIALAQAVNEVIFMIRKGEKSMNESCELLCDGPQSLADSVIKREEIIDRLQKEIIEYLVHLSQGDTTPEQSKIIPEMIHVINDAERLGDHAESLVKIKETLKAIDHTLTPEAAQSIKDIRDCLNKQFDAIYRVLHGIDPHAAKDALDAAVELTQVIEQATAEKVKRLDAGRVSVQGSVVFLDALAHLERVGDHLVNIAERTGSILEVVRD